MNTMRIVGLTAVVLCAAIVGCRKSVPKSTPTTVVHTYTLRAQVVEVPVVGDPRSDFVIHHEAIPEFKGAHGEMGMDTMDMPFPLKDGVSLDGIAKGDKVEVVFDVPFDLVKDSPTDWYVTRVTKLPAETALDFTSMKQQH